MRKILILGLICFFIFAHCEGIKNPHSPLQLSAIVIMEGIPSWRQSVYNNDIEHFGLTADKYGGRVKSISKVAAEKLRVNVTLYDPDGNYLADKYATFWEIGVGYVGTSVTLEVGDFLYWICWWPKEENAEIWEKLYTDYSNNPYRPDRAPEKCIKITWENSNL